MSGNPAPPENRMCKVFTRVDKLSKQVAVEVAYTAITLIAIIITFALIINLAIRETLVTILNGSYEIARRISRPLPQRNEG